MCSSRYKSNSDVQLHFAEEWYHPPRGRTHFQHGISHADHSGRCVDALCGLSSGRDEATVVQVGWHPPSVFFLLACCCTVAARPQYSLGGNALAGCFLLPLHRGVCFRSRIKAQIIESFYSLFTANQVYDIHSVQRMRNEWQHDRSPLRGQNHCDQDEDTQLEKVQ